MTMAASVSQTTPTHFLPPSNAKARVSQFMQQLQDEICQGLQQLDGGGRFQEDSWKRPEGGGGRSRIMRDGTVFEQAGVNFSEVWGDHLPTSILAQRPEAEGHRFYATGTSMVLHPHNPYVPTVHLNYRYFEAGPVWWFGGGADLTPYYPFAEDAAHFHSTFKQACDAHHPEYYAVFKRWCDEYFYLKHRQETRGVGGLFLTIKMVRVNSIAGHIQQDLRLFTATRWVRWHRAPGNSCLPLSMIAAAHSYRPMGPLWSGGNL